MKAIVLLGCFYVTFAKEYQLFGAWPRVFQDKMDNCLWFPRSTISQDNAEIPKITYNSTSQLAQICDLPPMASFGCDWRFFVNTIKDCIYLSDIPDWRRQAYKKILDVLPNANCVSIRTVGCRCCSPPFHPNEKGTKCIKEEEKTCPAFNEPNNWSECLWFPKSSIISKFKDHCNLGYGRLVNNVVPPPGLTIPNKCGMCSFRIRCRNRNRTDGCYHVQVDKKACGTEDCPECADVCTVPYSNFTIPNSNFTIPCRWINFIDSTILKKVNKLTASPKIPNWRKRGIKENLLNDLPYGICKDINGQCKCCCHPYKPNADGTKCVLRDRLCFFDHMIRKIG